MQFQLSTCFNRPLHSNVKTCRVAPSFRFYFAVQINDLIDFPWISHFFANHPAKNINKNTKIMEKLKSEFDSHIFSSEIAGQTIVYRVLKMRESLLIYIGKKEEESLDSLALAFINQQNADFTGSTTIIGGTENDISKSLAEKLSKRLQKPCFISFNVSTDFFTNRSQIEQRLLEEVTVNPDWF